MVRALSGLLICAQLASGAPLTRDKLALLPWMWPHERRALTGKLETELAANRSVEPLLRAEGIDARAIDLLKRLPDGPRFHERYIHRLTLAVKELSGRQRELLKTLVHTLDGAQLTLQASRAAVDAKTKSLIDYRINMLERRFWRLVMFTLTLDQRYELKSLLPQANQQPPNALGHLYLLEGLTPRQSTRLTALHKEYESEIAADVAAQRRLRTQGKTAEADAIARQLEDRGTEFYKEVEPIFTKRQWKQLRALMPFVPPQDRKEHPRAMVTLMKPRADQLPRLQELGKKIETVRAREFAEAERKRKAMDAEIGQESPQATMMNMMAAGAEATTAAVMAAAAHEAVVQILDPDQVSLWLLSR